jgi:hypothetical protein
MNKSVLGLMLLFSTTVSADFSDFFIEKTLRIDYYHAGNHDSEEYYFDEALIEPYWAGSHINLIDTFFYGQNYVEVKDPLTGKLIYSRGYSTLFAEWQTTTEAKTTRRALTETVVVPLPKKEADIRIFSRNRKGEFEERFLYQYLPDNYFIKTERRLVYPAFDVLLNGKPEHKVDIVILPEGYNESELGVFISDCKEFAMHLFSFEPYGQYRDRFNIRGVLAASEHSGSDIPADSTWKKTLLNTTFYTFDSERYCMTYDNKSVRDMAANAPYDQIYILVNTDKYGGGAIYNYYSISVNSNLHAAKIFIHELGHGFAGLGDEYYDSEVAYNDFYPTDVEPWEPNLTTLVDFSAKWQNLIGRNVPVPTPAEKKYIHETGVFEGGGYASKGVYRPAHDCMMNSFKGNDFCEVCKLTIEKMILYYSE